MDYKNLFRKFFKYKVCNHPIKTNQMKEVKRSIIINAKPEEVFAFMDDIENTGMHMTNTNAPMMGNKLAIKWLSENKTGVGAKYKWDGNVMGMKMDFTVEVTKWIQGKEKIWETIGDAKMIVLAWFRMYFLGMAEPQQLLLLKE